MTYTSRRICFTILKILTTLVAILVASAGGWVLYSTQAKLSRETQSPQRISTPGHWIRVEDDILHIQEWGDPHAPVVLLVHGTGAWSGTWFELPKALAAAGWHVVALDLPPFGLSQAKGPLADYTRERQAHRILSVAQSFLPPVALVGHSFGAGPALEAAMVSTLEHGPIAKLVLIDPALGLGSHGEPPSCTPRAEDGPLSNRTVREAAVAATATWPGFTSFFLRGFVYRKEVVNEDILPAYRIPFGRSGYSAELGDWAWAFAGSACEKAQSLSPDALRAWHTHSAMPLEFIWGDHDTITPPEQATSLLSWMPGATIHWIQGAGHIPHIEDPDATVQALHTALGNPLILGRSTSTHNTPGRHQPRQSTPGP